ncbi:MAG: alpha/beta hydrolase [Oscillospiraceae bacterium]|nr:alpha/beta hydrolase [Oscillospiraceae bacterium]
MKKKSIVIAVIAAALVLALLFGGMALYSHLTQGRSWAATVFAWQLHKDEYTTDEAFAAYLAEKSAENAQPYVIPESVDMSVSVVRHIYQELDYFVLNPDGDGLLFYFAGGSYIDQPRAVHWQFLDHLAADTNMTIIVPLYPKLPDTDAAGCYETLLAFYQNYDKADDRVVFMGDSAGGGMALSLAMQLRDAGLDGPEALVLLCPWVDVTMSNPAIADYENGDPALDSEMLAHLGALWAGELDVTDPTVGPINGNLEELGYITLITGTNELLYPDITALDELLTDAGIAHDLIVGQGMFHVWPLYMDYGIPESQETYEQILAALM